MLAKTNTPWHFFRDAQSVRVDRLRIALSHT